MMKRVLTSQCLFCSKKLSKPSNAYRHMRKVHGSDFWRKRQLLIIDGEYRCMMHKTPMRFINRANHKRHLYFCHREDDQQHLSKFGLHRDQIIKKSNEMRGTLIEYRKVKIQMEESYQQGHCSHQDILDMETLNHDFEIAERNRQIQINYSLIEQYRQTIQPTREWDEDDYKTKRRLTCWQCQSRESSKYWRLSTSGRGSSRSQRKSKIELMMLWQKKNTYWLKLVSTSYLSAKTPSGNFLKTDSRCSCILYSKS